MGEQKERIFLDCAPVEIGARCQIATNVQLLTASHPLEPGARRDRLPRRDDRDRHRGGRRQRGREGPAGGVLAVGNPCRPIRDV